MLSPRWGIKKLGSTGLPAPGVQVRLVSLDDATRDCEFGEVGELWSKPDANLNDYLHNPEKTVEKLTPEGWLKTGDLMVQDEQGYLYFRGRRDDMINVGGENVYPKEVENILATHPAVADVCVVPGPHALKGQAPVAWVVLRADQTADEASLQAFFLERGPAYAHPRRVFFVDALPLTGTNKVDKQHLIQQTQQQMA